MGWVLVGAEDTKVSFMWIVVRCWDERQQYGPIIALGLQVEKKKNKKTPTGFRWGELVEGKPPPPHTGGGARVNPKGSRGG